MSPKGDMFTYNLDVSRMVQARGSSMAQTLSLSAYPDAGLGLAENAALSGHRPVGVGGASRGAPASSFGSTGSNNSGSHNGSSGGGGSSSSSNGSGIGGVGRQYQASAFGWSGGYAEDTGIDYAMCPPSLQSVAESSYLASPYRLASSAPSKQSLMYLDAEGPFGYGGVSVAAGMRPRHGAEAGGLAFQGLTSPGRDRSLSGGAERMSGSARGLLGSGSGSGPPPPPPPFSFATNGGAAGYRRSHQHHHQQQQQQQQAALESSAAAVAGGYHNFEGAQLPYGVHGLAGQLGRASDVLMAATAVSSGPDSGYNALPEPAFHAHDAHHHHHQLQHDHGHDQPHQHQHQARMQHSPHHTATAALPGSAGAEDDSQPAYLFHGQQHQDPSHGSTHDECAVAADVPCGGSRPASPSSALAKMRP